MARLTDIVDYCQQRLGLPDYPDFPGAMNGLQMENDGEVTRIAAAVDAGWEPFRQAVEAGADFLIVHHGMFWEPARPWIGRQREKLRLLLENNLAVYSAHLPLDTHPELGNNAQLARLLRVEPGRTFAPYQGRDTGCIAAFDGSRAELQRRLESLFPRVIAIAAGSERPREIAILTGSGTGAVDELAAAGADTLVTGELKEHFFNRAQEESLNLYLCGHYATETFGVRALAEEVARRFKLPWQFLATGNPL